MQNKKIVPLLIIALLLMASSCGLDNNVITTIKTGGNADDGYMPASVSSVETTAQNRTLLGERLLLSWLCTGDSLADETDELPTVSSIFDQSEVRIFEEASSTPLFIGTVPAEYNNKSYCIWASDADTGDPVDFSSGSTYSWKVRLSAGSVDTPDYTGPWGGPYTLLSPAATKELEGIEASGGEIERSTMIGLLPSLYCNDDGSDIKAFYLSGTKSNASIKGMERGGNGNWSELATEAISIPNVGYSDEGDNLKVLKSESTYHILAAVGGSLEYFTSDGSALSRVQFDGSDSISYNPVSRPAFALNETDNETELSIVYLSPAGYLCYTDSSDFSTPVEIQSGISTDIEDLGVYTRLMADSSKTLHLIYSTHTHSKLYYRRSTDQGDNWSSAEALDIESGGSSSYVLGLDAVLRSGSSGEGTLLVSYISRIADDDSPSTLNWVELDLTATAGSRWGASEKIPSTLWYKTSLNNVVAPRIRLDADGTPYLSAVVTAADTPQTITENNNTDFFPIPKIALFTQSGSSWVKHHLDVSGSTNGLDYEGDGFQFDWSIDNTGYLHILFQELTWSDTSFRQEYFFSNPDLLKVKYSQMELDSMEFN